ncbi:MAG: hypothetical protein GX249_01750 [Firmicutes bacterium]|nr:hypothetical protein [Bacillota bacterium]
MLSLIEQFLTEVPVKRIQTKVLEDYLIKNLTLQRYWQKGGYPAFAALIGQLVMENRLKPIKVRKTNGLNPPLFNGYQIIPAAKSLPLEEQRQLLKYYHPKLDLAQYLKRPDLYKRDEPYLEALDRYFRQATETPARPVTINERSFELFRDEKFLASGPGQALLESVGLVLADLNCHYTYEPFFYYVPALLGLKQELKQPSREQPFHILIVENKDTFFSFKSLFLENMVTWDGITFKFLIYGEGRKILRSFSFLKELFPGGIIPSNLICHYFGDLDPEGIAIYDELVQAYQPQGFKIVAARFFYAELFKRHGTYAPKLKTSQRRQAEAIDRFLAEFELPLQNDLEHLLLSGRYLPQEGLSIALLAELHKLHE